MSNIKFISDYKDDEKYRASFNKLAQSTFGIDFEEWYQNGFWKDRYICYSYADMDDIVANVSVSLLEFKLKGQMKRALQIGTVMTHEDYRGRGLSASLINTILKEYENKYDILYLFANETVLDFYPRFGFKAYRQGQYSIYINANEAKANSLKKLDVSEEEDLNIISRLTSNRIPLSEEFSVSHAEQILMWYCLNVFSNDIYYLEDEDIVVFFKEDDTKLYIYDIVSDKKIDTTKTIMKIASGNVKEAVLYFTPDHQISYLNYTESEEQGTLFIKTSSVNLPEKFSYPITAQA